MLVFPLTSRGQRLRAFVRTAESVHLFVNDLTPNPNSLASDFTEPDASIGYTPILLRKTAWRLENVGPAVRAQAEPIRWVFTDGVADIYGHFALDAEGALLWAERLPQVFRVLRQDDAIQVRLMIDSIDESRS